MIIYDGVSIESVADVKIEDVRVSPIQFDEVTHPRSLTITDLCWQSNVSAF